MVALVPIRNSMKRRVRHIRHCKTSEKLYQSSDLPRKADFDNLRNMRNLAIYAGLCMASRRGSSPAAPAIFRVALPCLQNSKSKNQFPALAGGLIFRFSRRRRRGSVCA